MSKNFFISKNVSHSAWGTLYRYTLVPWLTSSINFAGKLETDFAHMSNDVKGMSEMWVFPAPVSEGISEGHL